MKISLSKAGLFAAIGFSLFILFSVFHNWANERHTVTFFQESQIEGYEAKAAVAQINTSSALAWAEVPMFNKVLGFIFLALTWVGVWLVDSDKLEGKKKVGDPGNKKNLALKVGAIFAPLVACAAIFLLSYSMRFSNNWVEIYKDKFDAWVASGEVVKKGERTYVDKNGQMKALFTNKRFIK